MQDVVENSRRYVGKIVTIEGEDVPTGEKLTKVKAHRGFKGLSGHKFPDSYTLEFETVWRNVEAGTVIEIVSND